jgi:hypothetical protein
MITETRLDEYLNEEARYTPPLTNEEYEAITRYYHEHCSECDEPLTDEDWQRGTCPTCGVVLLPF